MSNRPPVGEIRILVAEDSHTQAQRLRALLERQGYRVVLAANGREALAAARTQAPTLVISDVVMPEMDGYQLAKALKSDPALAHVPVMLVTTLSDPNDVIRGLEAGADNFVVKPFEASYLCSRVESLLENHEIASIPRGLHPGLTVVVQGEPHVITASREQILNLLLSTYEAAVERNKDLVRTQNELQAAVRELESFSHSVSHDLRGPLHKISGFGTLLLEDYAQKLDETGRHHIERMVASASRMDELIEALLALSQVACIDLVAGDVDVTAVAERALAELREQEPSRRCEIRVRPGMRARGDRRLFEAVLTNLVGNAWKFTSRRDVARIEVGEAPSAGELGVFFVRDNGAGFDPRFAENLFSPFRRLHGEREFPGTGIGLATVRRVVERHGGSVWAESAVDAGATFFFTLPKSPHAGPRPPAEPG